MTRERPKQGSGGGGKGMGHPTAAHWVWLLTQMHDPQPPIPGGSQRTLETVPRKLFSMNWTQPENLQPLFSQEGQQSPGGVMGLAQRG